MEWTQQMLARYLGRVRLVVEFQGLSEGELSAALEQGALRRLGQVEAVVFNDEMSDSEKIQFLQTWFTQS